MKKLKILLMSDLHYGYSGLYSNIEENRRVIGDFVKEISVLDYNIMVIVGDLISNKRKQMRGLFKLLRKYIDKPIFVVKGNHDYWESYYTLNVLNNKHNELFKEYDIQYLQNENYETDNVIITGFDGWYGSYDSPTNDKHRIKNYNKTYYLLRERANIKINEILNMDTKGKKLVVCTHFGFNGGDRQFCDDMNFAIDLYDKADYLFYGHSHRYDDSIINNCRVINTGSDYNKPKYRILEV
jgi:predicted phosphodiesterase